MFKNMFKNMFANFFIKKPMKYNFIATIVLKILLLISLCYQFWIYNEKIIKIFIFLAYSILVAFCYFNNEDLKSDLGDVEKQVQEMLNNENNKLNFNFLIYLFVYVGLYIFFQPILNNIENEFLKKFIDKILLYVTLWLFYSRALYSLFKIAPFLIYVSSFIIFLLLSVIGIESSFLNWTFLSLLFVTALPQLINENLILIVPQKIRKKIPKNKIKVNLMKIRLNLFIFLVFFYFCLNLSEKISKSNEFAYLINKYHYSHYSPLEFDFFSAFTFFCFILNLIFLTIAIILFVSFKDFIIYKAFTYLFKIDENKILNHKLNLKVPIKPLIISIFCFVVYIFSNYGIKYLMQNEYRGVYYKVDSNNCINYEKQLIFDKDKIIFENEEYIYDNTSLTFKKFNNITVGGINTSNNTIVLNTNLTNQYIFLKLNWVKNDKGEWNYLVDFNSKKATGWLQDSGKWYFFNQNGVMQKWWIKDNITWYFLNGSGAMQTGWLLVDGKWYFLDESGAMATGWVKVGDYWYYMNNSGAMQTGCQQVGGKWYFLNPSGELLTNITTPDGYKVNVNGEWV